MLRANYPHASYKYAPLDFKDYFAAAIDIILARCLRATNLTFHLPMELMYKSTKNVNQGMKFVRWVSWWSRFFGILVVWENTVWLHDRTWNLRERATWDYIPKNIHLCLDTGHLMIGSKNVHGDIDKFIRLFGSQVKHLHLHENDLIHDLHRPPGRYLTPELLRRLTRDRTWMFEPKS